MRWIATVFFAAVLIALAASLPGCNAVLLSAEYSKLLDQTADLSAETARRAQAGTLPSGDMRDALVYQAYTWKQFQNAAKGIQADPVINETVEPTTQPTNLTDLAPAPE